MVIICDWQINTYLVVSHLKRLYPSQELAAIISGSTWKVHFNDPQITEVRTARHFHGENHSNQVAFK